MRTATAILLGLAGLCNIAFAQDAVCSSDEQTPFIPLVGSTDAAEYCFEKVLDLGDDSSTSTTTTADSLRFRRRTNRTPSLDDHPGRHGGRKGDRDDDDDNSVQRYVPSLILLNPLSLTFRFSLLKSLSQGPASVASTFCSCNFPSTPVPCGTATATITPSGFFNGTLNATITSNSTLVNATSTVSLNLTTSTSDDIIITPIATLFTTEIGDDSTTSGVVDDSAVSVGL